MSNYLSNIFLNLKFPLRISPLSIQNFLNSSKTRKNNLFRKIIINFSICYFLFNFGQKYIYSHSQSSKATSTMQCINLKFWEKSKEGIELNNLQKRAFALQYNANNPIEDRYSAVELKNFPGYFISVLDGHGGFQLAEFANERLFKYFDSFYLQLKENNINEKLNEDELVINSLLKTFEKVEKEFYELALDLYRKGEGRSATVGSCALVSIITPNKIYTAQLGDSKAKLFRKNKEKENKYEIVKLTNTHNAEKIKEQAILFKEFKDKDIVVCKRPNNKVCYVKGRLQPTRSLGDFHLKYKEFNQYVEGDYKRPVINFNGPYIKSIPEIKVTEITKDDEYIVMGTDGLWDFLSSQDVASILKNHNKIESIANSLFNETMMKAARGSKMTVDQMMNMPAGKKRNLYDDITLIVFDLKH